MKAVMSQPMARCPACGEGTLQPRREMHDVEHAGQHGQVPVLLAVCDHCGSELAGAAEALANKRAMIAFRKRVDGLMQGAAVRAFRVRFGLSQEVAAALFGGGKVGFSRYENDDVAQSEAMDTLLELCAAVPSNLLQIARMKGVQLGPDTVRRLDDHLRDQLLSLGRRIQKMLDEQQASVRRQTAPTSANDSGPILAFSLKFAAAESWTEAA